jgi:hypothetical protein
VFILPASCQRLNFSPNKLKCFSLLSIFRDYFNSCNKAQAYPEKHLKVSQINFYDTKTFRAHFRVVSKILVVGHLKNKRASSRFNMSLHLSRQQHTKINIILSGFFKALSRGRVKQCFDSPLISVVYILYINVYVHVNA